MSTRVFDGTYQVIREIGRGGMGTVYLAYHTRLEKYVVLKQLRCVGEDSLLRKEVDILKNLHHPNLPQVYDFFQERGEVYTVIDYVEGNTLAEYISGGYHCTERKIGLWLSQLASALKYLHAQHPPILHCDIKPENIIITPQGDAVLIDFGVSLSGGYEQLAGISPLYASPEQYQLAMQISMGVKTQIVLDGRTDVYSLAATFYHLMTGMRPSPLTPPVPLAKAAPEYSEGLSEIIDRAMRFSLRSRTRSAEQLLRSVERYGFRNAGYRAQLIARCLSILISAVMIGFGAYFILAGGVKKQAEDFSAGYAAVFAAIDTGNPEQARRQSEALLEAVEFQRLLDENPNDRAALLAVCGEVDFVEGNYDSAAYWFHDAVESALFDQKGNYLRNELVALTRAKKLDDAVERMTSVDALSMSEEDRCFVTAMLAAAQGDAQQSISATLRLIDLNADGELCAEAALAVAGIVENVEDEIAWLEYAESYGERKPVIRGLAAAYTQLAIKSSGETAAWAIHAALTHYQALTSGLYAGKADRLNYAIALRVAGQYAQALTVLDALCADYPEDYRVLSNMAFTCYELGKDDAAKEYCALALNAWRRELSADKDMEDSDLVQNLLTLAERYDL